MKYYNILALSSGVEIFFAIILLLLSIFLIWYLYRSIKLAKVKYFDKDSNAEINKDKFNALITRKIGSSRKSNFTVFRLEIQEFESLKRTYGDIQYASAINSYLKRLKAMLGISFKVFNYDDENIYIYSSSSLPIKPLEDTAKKIIIECRKTQIIAGTLKFEADFNMGIVTYPGSGNTVEEINQNLLIALVSAKRKGINNYAVFDAQLGNKQSEEYKYYTEIKNAITAKEFILYYQPIVDLQTLEVLGGEALIRWEHKSQGTLTPAKFLPIMEKTGDINWVGFWSFEQLIKQYLRWKEQYPDKNLKLSMNLSPKQLLNSNIIEELRRVIKRYKVQTENFIMEIVQFALFEKIDTVTDNIKKLSQMGFKVAIDNFGLEFSTLQVLTEYDISIIKLDKAFINDTRENRMSKNILNMLIDYANEKDIIVVAEGIEDIELLNYIRKLNINCGQGYYFSKPKKPQEFIQDAILKPWRENE